MKKILYFIILVTILVTSQNQIAYSQETNLNFTYENKQISVLPQSYLKSDFGYVVFTEDLLAKTSLLIIDNKIPKKIKYDSNFQFTGITNAYKVKDVIYIECHINPSLCGLIIYNTKNSSVETFYYTYYKLFKDNMISILDPPHFSSKQPDSKSDVYINTVKIGSIPFDGYTLSQVGNKYMVIGNKVKFSISLDKNKKWILKKIK